MEPASQATVWDFGLGKFSGADQFCNAIILDGQANTTPIACGSELLGQLVATKQRAKGAVK